MTIRVASSFASLVCFGVIVVVFISICLVFAGSGSTVCTATIGSVVCAVTRAYIHINLVTIIEACWFKAFFGIFIMNIVIIRCIGIDSSLFS